MTVSMDRFHKRLSKKARRGFRGWPVATIAFYGPDLSLASKVAVGIIRTEGGDAEDLQTWLSDDTDVRRDPLVGQEIISFIELHGAKTVAMAEQIIGCPHQEGVDYDGDWCPVCHFWKGRDRFTGKLFS
jgi:hypothetical protein